MLNFLQRAWTRRGDERSAVVEVLKGISASLVAYIFAVLVLDSPVPAFAAFSALLVTQVTAYRSALESLRYVAAVVVGVGVTGAIGITLGQTFWSLAVLVTITLVVGRWRRFGAHYRQAAVVGLFAFVAADEEAYLLALLITVLSGAAIGVAASALLAPRIRFSDAASAVQEVASTLAERLSELAGMLQSDQRLHDLAELRARLADLTDLVDRSRAEVDFNEQNRPLSLRQDEPAEMPLLTDHRRAIETLARAASNVDSIVRVLSYTDRYQDGHGAGIPPEFLTEYGHLVDDLAGISAAYGELHWQSAGQDLHDLLDNTTQRHEQVSGRLREHHADMRALADAGSLLVDAGRFIAEFQYALDRDDRPWHR